eukprot:Skav226888  [mRNA]  locus=scaffold1187:485198:490229:+ [translate_table: standard]
MVDVLHREILLMLICPCLAWLAAPWTTCEKGSPSWLYAVYFPILVRSKWIEWRLMPDFNITNVFPHKIQINDCMSILMSFALWGPLDHLDWFTDGAAPVQLSWYLLIIRQVLFFGGWNQWDDEETTYWDEDAKVCGVLDPIDPDENEAVQSAHGHGHPSWCVGFLDNREGQCYSHGIDDINQDKNGDISQDEDDMMGSLWM